MRSTLHSANKLAHAHASCQPSPSSHLCATCSRHIFKKVHCGQTVPRRGISHLASLGDEDRMLSSYKENLKFYTSYHSNPINQLIHFIFVPVIFWSALVLLDYLQPIQVPAGLWSSASGAACVPSKSTSSPHASKGAPVSSL